MIVLVLFSAFFLFTQLIVLSVNTKKVLCTVLNFSQLCLYMHILLLQWVRVKCIHTRRVRYEQKNAWEIKSKNFRFWFSFSISFDRWLFVYVCVCVCACVHILLKAVKQHPSTHTPNGVKEEEKMARIVILALRHLFYLHRITYDI